MAGAAGQFQGGTGRGTEAADIDFGGRATRRAAQSLCGLPAVFFGPQPSAGGCIHAYNGAIHDDVGGRLTPINPETCPTLPPDVDGFPLVEAVVDGIPMAEFAWRVLLGDTDSGERQNRFDEQTIAQHWGLQALCLIAVGRGSILAQASSVRSARTDIGMALHGWIIAAIVRRTRGFVNTTSI